MPIDALPMAISTGDRAAAAPAVPLQSGDSGIGGLAALVLFFGAGLLIVYKGFRTYQVGRLMRDTPTERVRSIAVGRTELQGVARSAGTTFDRPFSEGDCLYARYRIEEYDEDAGEDDPDWDTIDSGSFVAPFFIEDDTGRVLVDADRDGDFEISGANKTKITVTGSQTEPDAVVEFLDNHSSVSPHHRTGITGSLFDERRQYTEWVLPVDADAYVFGGARPLGPDDERVLDAETGSNEARLRIAADESSGQFIVSDRAAGALESAYSKRAPAMAAIGLLVSVVSLYLLLVELGLGA